MDSGATHHFTPDLQMLSNKIPYQGCDQVTIGNGKQISISNTGSTFLNTPSTSLHLKHVLHTPEISHNLISVRRLCADNNVSVEFFPNCFVVKDLRSKQILLQGNLDRGLYKAIANSTLHDAVAAPPISFISHTSNVSNLPNLWHNRLGHPAFPIVNKVLQSCSQKSFPVSQFDFCNSCQFGKSHRLPFTNSSSRAVQPFELIHTDLWGASPVVSVTGMRYFILFVDNYSRFSWIYFLKAKSDAFPTFIKFKALVETQFEAKIKTVQTDSGGEYVTFTPFLTNLGILHRLSCPITSQQNGRVEQKHRHVVEVGLSMMSFASMPLKYWS